MEKEGGDYLQAFTIKKKVKTPTIVLKTEPFKVDTEFLTPVTKNEELFKNSTVIYVRTDNLPAGYYRVLNIRNNNVDIATEYGLVTVNKTRCYFTQELITAYISQICIIFKDAKASNKEDTAWIDEMLEAETKNNPINRIIL